jgi:hypothetical protein
MVYAGYLINYRHRNGIMKKGKRANYRIKWSCKTLFRRESAAGSYSIRIQYQFASILKMTTTVMPTPLFRLKDPTQRAGRPVQLNCRFKNGGVKRHGKIKKNNRKEKE